MRSLIIVVAACALLASAGSALASGRAAGTVASVNPTVGVLVLQDGRSFVFSNGDALRRLVPGQLVGVHYFGEGQGTRLFDPCPAATEDEPAF